jgi:hypothetical protein
MTRSSATDIVLLAIQKIVSTSIDDHLIAFFGYGKDEDFKCLWEYVADPKKWTEKHQQFMVIVSDGPPPVTITSELDFPEGEFRDFFTADAWAVGFYTACVEEKITPPQTLILDLDLFTGRDIRFGSVFNPEINSEIRKYIHFHSCANQQDSFFLDDFVNNLKSINTSSSKSPLSAQRKDDQSHDEINACKLYWKALRKHLANNKIDAESQHDISNQVGALIMSAGLPHEFSVKWEGEREKLAAILVKRLLRPVNLVFSDRFPVVSRLLEKKLLSAAFSEPGGILLVDDHAEDGYSAVLSEAIIGGKHEYYKFSAQKYALDQNSRETDPKEFKAKDAELLGTKFLTGNPLFKKIEGMDLLFLDLRLWKLGESESFLKKYIKIADSLIALIREHEGSSADRIIRYIDTLEQALKATPSSHRRLAVLPMLIAGIDPSLPIVLFSSTQHRGVIHVLRDETNVIADFCKPFLGGDDDDTCDPEVIMQGLYCASARALEMVEIRQVWKQAIDKWYRNGRATEKNLIRTFDNLKWHKSWPSCSSTGNSPVDWLRNIWLPLAQQGEYALAATLPWNYLRDLLGTTRLQILKGSEQKGSDQEGSHQEAIAADNLKLIRSAHSRFSAQGGSDCKKRTTDREVAVISAVALIELLAYWDEEGIKGSKNV